MEYAFACPIEGCTQVMSIEASSRPEGVEKLTLLAADHLDVEHPEINKNHQQIERDVKTGTTLRGESKMPRSEKVFDKLTAR